MDILSYLSELDFRLKGFREAIEETDVRARVKALVPVLSQIRKIGRALAPGGSNASARDRLLAYFRMYPQTMLNRKELEVVAAIPEWARRVRELRVQLGWPILSGATARELETDEESDVVPFDPGLMRPDDYVLLRDCQDKQAAYRWNVANEIRRSRIAVKSRLLEFLRRNVGVVVTSEELRYVARGSSEWARRVRELRTEEGWPVVTKMTGRPDLGVGEYVLEMDRQSPQPDRQIPDAVRRHVLRRDDYRCRQCRWHHGLWNRSDPRFLEIHHVVPYSEGGETSPDNLITLCNVCHDAAHGMAHGMDK